MYLHIGENTVVKKKDIIGIFDLDNVTVQKNSRNFLNKAEKEGLVETVSYELPKSFILCSKRKSKQIKIYISQITPQTLLKRSEEQILKGD